MKKAIFFDRDGVIVRDDVGHVHKVADFKLETNAVEGLKKLSSLDVKLIIITNQSGIAKQLFTESDYYLFNNHLLEQLRKEGIEITAVYHCPHHPEGKGEYKQECDCRKPGIKMIQDAVKEYDLDISNSWFIGDKTSDILAGKNAGCKTVLVKTGYSGKDNLFKVKTTTPGRENWTPNGKIYIFR